MNSADYHRLQRVEGLCPEEIRCVDRFESHSAFCHRIEIERADVLARARVLDSQKRTKA
ncbi:hypothetical protein HBA55_29535 [Pseudomaricurvus alkylphenolicus]|uniref:hypothetical protein n=1 Tax=Pseudomaricurvus alkylphenolicus TaxID=1306991 RepID=UPI00141DCD53|nr:hypothetical protein [Pseudomaricurvus alkylphenolicus]NIB43781.1 hypothetical protein [Pseudomaricurvus alkylphenolicus]